MYILCCSIKIISSVLSLYGISMSSVLSFEKIHTHSYWTGNHMAFLHIALESHDLQGNMLYQEHIEPAREHVTPYMLVYTVKFKHG